MIRRLAAHRVADALMGSGLLLGFVYIVGVSVLTPGSTVNRAVGLVASLIVPLGAAPFLRRLRIRMVADRDGLHLYNTFTTQHHPWSTIVGFRRAGRPDVLTPYMHFGDGIIVDFTDGSQQTLPLTMARQPYRQERHLDDRASVLNRLLRSYGGVPDLTGKSG